jgi:prefoldin subunit 5
MKASQEQVPSSIAGGALKKEGQKLETRKESVNPAWSSLENRFSILCKEIQTLNKKIKTIDARMSQVCQMNEEVRKAMDEYKQLVVLRDRSPGHC